MSILSPAPLTPAAVAELVAGTWATQAPEGELLVDINTLEAAGPTHVAFAARAKFRAQATASRAGVILVPPDFDGNDPRLLRVADVWAAVLRLIEYFHPEAASRDHIHPTAIVDPTAIVGELVEIGPYSVIGAGVRIGSQVRIGSHAAIGAGSVIGDGCVLHDRVTLYRGVEVGRRVILHSGVVLGADGFKYEVINRRLTKMPQVGTVVIEDDVEIGANTTIDRASFSATRIGARTKIDNLVQIGHNVEVGTDTIIVAQVSIGGSTKIGRGVIIAGQAAIADNLVIGDGVRLAGQSALHTDVPAGATLAGTPAMDAKLWFKTAALIKRLPGLFDRVKPLLEEYDRRQGGGGR